MPARSAEQNMTAFSPPFRPRHHGGPVTQGCVRFLTCPGLCCFGLSGRRNVSLGTQKWDREYPENALKTVPFGADPSFA